MSRVASPAFPALAFVGNALSIMWQNAQNVFSATIVEGAS
jgi:hypothetical protein